MSAFDGYEVNPNFKEDWISSSYDRPSYTKSMFETANSAPVEFVSSILKGVASGSDWLQKELNLPNSPGPAIRGYANDMDEYVRSLDRTINNPNLTTTQKSADFAAGFISSNIVATPLFFAGGEVVEGLGFVASKIPYFGPIASKVGATKVLGSELGSIAKSAAGGAAVGMFGGIKEAGAMGALAATFHVAPYAVGKIFGKIRDKYRGPGSAEQTIPNSPMPEVPEPGKPIDEAFVHQNVSDGTITAEEGEILKAYATDPENPEIQTKIANYLVREGHPVDVFNKRVMFEMMSSQDIDNLTHAVSEQLLSAGGKAADTSLSDYVVNKSLDNLRDNKMHMLDGLEGYNTYLTRELEKRGHEISDLHKNENNIEPKTFDKNNRLIQEKLYREVKSGKLSIDDPSVPKNVSRKIRDEGRLRNVNNLIKSLENNKEYSKDNIPKKIQNKIELLKADKEKILSRKRKLLNIKDELTSIDQELFKTGRLEKGYQFKDEYNRLVDLASFSNNAKNLLSKVRLSKDYHTQSALKNIVQTYTKLMRANVGKFADQSKVLDYIKNKQRAGEATPNEALKPIEPIKVDMLPTEKPRVKVTEQGMEKIEKPQSEEPKDEVDQMMQDLMKQVKSSESKLALEEFTKDKEKFDQFRKAGSKLQNLIDCVVRNI